MVKGLDVFRDWFSTHPADVFRLYRIVDPDRRPQLSPRIAEDLLFFLTAALETDIDARRFGYRNRSLADACSEIRVHYGLPGPTPTPVKENS